MKFNPENKPAKKLKIKLKAYFFKHRSYAEIITHDHKLWKRTRQFAKRAGITVEELFVALNLSTKTLVLPEDKIQEKKQTSRAEVKDRLLKHIDRFTTLDTLRKEDFELYCDTADRAQSDGYELFDYLNNVLRLPFKMRHARKKKLRASNPTQNKKFLKAKARNDIALGLYFDKHEKLIYKELDAADKKLLTSIRNQTGTMGTTTVEYLKKRELEFAKTRTPFKQMHIPTNDKHLEMER